MASATTTAGAAGRRVLVWLRNDLRLMDNAALAEAVSAVSSQPTTQVLPVYVFDPRFFAASAWGSPKTGPYRAKFVLQSVLDLKRRLRGVGSDLLVTVGQPEHILPRLLPAPAPQQGQGQGPLVLTMEETTSEELRVDRKVAEALRPLHGRLQRVWGHSLYHLDDLQAESGPFPASRGGVRALMPDVFTPFKDKAETRARVRAELPAPRAGQLPLPPLAARCALAPGGGAPAEQDAAAATLGELLGWEPTWDALPWASGVVPAHPAKHPNAVLDFEGGETAALARLKYYLWDSDLLATYFETRNGMLGGDYSTKFAPWLAAGCLSPRTIYHEIKKYEKQRTSNKSTYWVVFELIWRDFFKFFSIKHGNRIFFETGTSGLPLSWTNDRELWDRWREGRTGLPLVDANMRELAATGFMSNRGRQNVASHLVLDLGVDWRKGAALFEELLVDYDVTSNWGNWVAAAGLTGGRLNLFNITKQSNDYDPSGDYIRTWIPELKNVPARRIHEPWLMSKEEQAKYGVQIGVDYPSPIDKSRYGRPHNSGGGGSRGGGGYDGRSGQGRPGSGRGSYQGGRGGGRGDGRPRSGAPQQQQLQRNASSAAAAAMAQLQKKRPVSEFDRFG